MDTYRVNRYRITGPGHISNRLIQGAFRYQKLNLSSTGVLKLRNVGVRPTIDTTAIMQLPGSFHSADNKIDAIWKVGARTIQMTEIPKGSIPDFWKVTSEGASVDSLAPQVLGSAAAAQLLNYNVDFKVKPVVDGFGFTVLSDTLNSGIYISCDVINKHIAAYVGSTTINQTLHEAQLPSNLTPLWQSQMSEFLSMAFLCCSSRKCRDSLVLPALALPLANVLSFETFH